MVFFLLRLLTEHVPNYLTRLEGKVDKKAMIRNQYIRIPHPVLNTKREMDAYN